MYFREFLVFMEFRFWVCLLDVGFILGFFGFCVVLEGRKCYFKVWNLWWEFICVDWEWLWFVGFL